ncbi:hypothetical protein [Streptomyces halobius]|nr:hypothetical protein [Streptomyces halobius]
MRFQKFSCPVASGAAMLSRRLREAFPAEVVEETYVVDLLVAARP